jgi:tetratricopeptide (TPR) repeat protein
MDWTARPIAVLLDSSIRILAVGAAVALLLAALRVRRGAVRHVAWCAVLAAMLAMPVLRMLAASLDVRIDLPRRVALATSHWLPEPNGDRDAAAGLPAASPAGVTRAPESARSFTPMERSSPDGAAPAPPRWPDGAMALYLTGLVAALVRLAIGWRRMHRLAARSRRLSLPGGAVFENDAVAAPVTVGTFAPRILLPTTWTSWPAWKLDAVLAHERAHVERRDPLVLLIVHVNRCLFWFHPLAWWLEREIRSAAEQACDDAAVRATGRPRQYAETLLDVADALRRSGAAVSWHALGAGGSGKLGARIDRALQGGSARTPAYRTAVLALGCALAVGVAAACRQKAAPSAAALQPDPAYAAEREKYRKENEARTADYEAGRTMSLDEAARIEARTRTGTPDMSELERLVIFYTWRDNHPLPWNDLIARRRPIALSIITSYSDRPIAIRASTLFRRSSDPVGREQAAAAWRAQVERAPANAGVLRNASTFFAASDVRLAIDLLERARSIDPDAKVAAPTFTGGARYWSTQLGYLYATAITGRTYTGGFPESGAVDETLSRAIRERMKTSTDAAALAAAGRMLLRAGGPGDGPTRALALEYFDRAGQLDPSLVEARAQAVSTRRHDREWEAWQRLRAAQKGFVDQARIQALKPEDPERQRLLHEAEAQALAQLPERDRFVLLAELARYASYVDARLKKYAEEALALAPKFKDDPAYAITLHEANLTLGRAALAAGDRTRARAYLIDAAKVPPSDDIAYSFEVLSNRALKSFLDSGEHAPVVEYLERMAQVNVVAGERLRKSAEAIKAGRMPDWYQAQSARAN